MRLYYNILWIEDDLEWLETTKGLFQDSMDDLGFRLSLTSLKDGDEIDELLSNNGFADFDLILVDFNLQNSQTGSTIIEKIRGNEIFTDVLFYSQDVGLVKDSISRLGLEGVYTADRNEIEDKFLVVMKTTIKKVQEVNTIRGLIMAETSVLDDVALELVSSFVSEGTDASKVISKYIFKCIKDALVQKQSDFNAYESSGDINALINDHLLFSAYVRARAMQKIGKIKVIEELNDFTSSYYKDVIQIRNIFAHAKEIKENGKTTLKGSNEEFDYNRCIDIRKSLIAYGDIFDKVKDKLV